ncbi:MAG: MlaD family protein [Actinomycetota bacterium]|nr:MlaD family protein [Actinomycetota bacterium]
MRQAISKHTRDFLAVILLIVVSAGVAAFILSNQRFYLPKWVPILGKDFYTLKGEFQTAQAVTPGQGQTVDIAGVKVGEVSNVDLKNGRGVVTMKISRKYSKVYRDASILLRPKTGLKDMILELDPGTSTAGAIKDNGTVPVSQTLPDVNLDEILAQLDGDTRDYLKILLGAGAQGLHQNGRNLSATFRRFEPTARDTLKITQLLAQRRANLQRVVHNFQLLSTALSQRDADLASFVQSSNAVFARFAAQSGNIQASLRELPPTLNVTQTALGKADTLARTLGTSLQALRPFARHLGPTLVALRPFLHDSTPIIRDQLRPFSRQALPVVRDLRPAITDLSALTPDLVTVTRVVNYLLNELAYNPPGPAEEGYLFWASWANHAGASVFSTQDAHGPIRRGLFLTSCSSIALLNQIASANQVLQLLLGLTNIPSSSVCPSQTSPFG